MNRARLVTIMDIRSAALIVLAGILLLLAFKKHKDFILSIVIAILVYKAVQTYGIEKLLDVYYSFTMEKVEFVRQGAAKVAEQFLNLLNTANMR